MIRIENIMPFPLAGFKHSEHSIWGSSFEINYKERTLLNAESGKGKTTFISLLFGLRSDYSGELYIQNQNSKDFSPDSWTKLRREVFSVVFQDLQLLPQLSLVDNLKLKHDLGSDISFEEVLSWIDYLGLSEKLEQSCGTLSFGQQQRVAIIRALQPKFQYLLLDEPFSHLDDKNTNLALDLILSRCSKLSTGCLLTTLGQTYDNQFDNMLYL